MKQQRMNKMTMMGVRKGVVAGLCVAALALSAGTAQAASTGHKLCVYDPTGARGDGLLAARDFKVEMQDQGVEMEVEAFIDERVAIEDFLTGQCDALLATALRTKQFNGTAAALDAIGASSIVRNGKIDMEASYDVVRRFVNLLSTPKAANLMVEGPYEVAGIYPLGAAYAFVSDRGLASLNALAGKRIAAFDHDKAQAELTQRIGARPVPVDMKNFGVTFNNHNADMVMVPSIAYGPFELYRGMGTQGAVIRLPLTISTYQLILRHDKYPKGLGQKAREYIAGNFDIWMATLLLADRNIPENRWVQPSPADTEKFVDLTRQVRISMAEKGFYSKQGLKLIKKLRCTIAPEAAECSDPAETW